MKIYVASTRRNEQQTDVVQMLLNAGYDVYDFKNPAPNIEGFAWSDIDRDWQSWTPEEFRQALRSHPFAIEDFDRDWDAMVAADACVLVMPCGRSAHIEAGYFVGAGKPLIILLSNGEPELMYRMADNLCVSFDEVIAALRENKTEVANA